MRARLFLLALAIVPTGFFLSGCGSGGPAGGSGGESGAAGTEIGNSAPIGPEVVARLRERAVVALAGIIDTPDAARYVDLRNGSSGSICGAVAVGEELPRPFLVTPEGRGVVSTTPSLGLEDPADPLPELYMQYCATAEELRRIGDAMNFLEYVPTAPPPLQAMPLPSEPEEDGVDAALGEMPPPVAPRDGGQDDDSFFNAVVRAPPPAAPRR